MVDILVDWGEYESDDEIIPLFDEIIAYAQLIHSLQGPLTFILLIYLP